MLDLLVVGGLNQDITVHVAHRPASGETIVGSGPRFDSGGKGANQAVAASCAGASVMLCAAVGDDLIGRQEIDALAGAGVATNAVKVDKESHTGTALILVTPDGENSIAVGAGANHRLDMGHVTRSARAWPSTVILAQSEPGPHVVDAAAQACLNGHARFVLSAAPVAGISPEALAVADPLIVNEHEAFDLIGTGQALTNEDTARVLLEATGARSVVVSFGPAGALSATDSSTTYAAALPIQPVDTTGSGDVLAGVVAAQLALGSTLADAVRTGCRLASLAATQQGARALLTLPHDVIWPA